MEQRINSWPGWPLIPEGRSLLWWSDRVTRNCSGGFIKGHIQWKQTALKHNDTMTMSCTWNKRITGLEKDIYNYVKWTKILYRKKILYLNNWVERVHTAPRVWSPCVKACVCVSSLCRCFSAALQSTPSGAFPWAPQCSWLTNSPSNSSAASEGTSNISWDFWNDLWITEMICWKL